MMELTRPHLNVLDAWLVSDSENPPPDLGSSGVPNLVQFLGIDPSLSNQSYSIKLSLLSSNIP